ncbi:MAG: DUF1294 domain-containing protein [Culicoidibacterales bacterium]
MNIISFFLYGLDKYKAKKKKWRISEKTLLLISLLSGVIGSVSAMLIFHHKTKKWYFWFTHIIAIIMWVFIVYKSTLLFVLIRL